jgi:hypothetical protein
MRLPLSLLAGLLTTQTDITLNITLQRDTQTNSDAERAVKLLLVARPVLSQFCSASSMRSSSVSAAKAASLSLHLLQKLDHYRERVWRF